MASPFTKLRQEKTLAHEIEQHFENLLRTKILLPGDKLPTEHELCEQLAVSRTPLREALHMLKARGLIRVKKGSGIYVNDLSSEKAIDSFSWYLEMKIDEDYVLHVVKFRQIIEPQIAALAAKNSNDDELAALEVIINAMDSCPQDDFLLQGELDREFHQSLAVACKNPILPLIMEPVYRQMHKMRSIIYKHIEEAHDSAYDYHKRIFLAVREKNEKLAFEMMEKHLKFAEEHSIKLNKKMV